MVRARTTARIWVQHKRKSVRNNFKRKAISKSKTPENKTSRKRTRKEIIASDDECDDEPDPKQQKLSKREGKPETETKKQKEFKAKRSAANKHMNEEDDIQNTQITQFLSKLHAKNVKNHRMKMNLLDQMNSIITTQ